MGEGRAEPGPRKKRSPVPCPRGSFPLSRLSGKPQRLWVPSAWTFTPVPLARTLPHLPRAPECGPSPSFPVPLSADPPPARFLQPGPSFPPSPRPFSTGLPSPRPLCANPLPSPQVPSALSPPHPQGPFSLDPRRPPHLASRQWGFPSPSGPLCSELSLSPLGGSLQRSPLPSPSPLGSFPRGCPLPPRTPHPRPSRSLPSPFWSRFPTLQSRASPATPVCTANLHLCPDPQFVSSWLSASFSDLSVPAPHPFPLLLPPPYSAPFSARSAPWPDRGLGTPASSLLPSGPSGSAPSRAQFSPSLSRSRTRALRIPHLARPFVRLSSCPHVRAKSSGSSGTTCLLHPPPPRPQLPSSAGCFICICLIFSPLGVCRGMFLLVTCKELL